MEKFLEYLPLVLSGTWITISVSVLSLFIAVVLGLLGAFGKLWGNPATKRICTIYTTLIRGVPDLLLILLIFYGGQIGINYITEFFEIDYINISPFISGVLTIGFIYGAYMVETFRGAILAIEQGQLEAGHSFGMTNLTLFRRITFPLMVKHAIASFMNNWLVLIKSTALISIVGLEDVVRKSNMAGQITKQPFTFLLTAAMIYIVITSLSLWVIRSLEKKYQVIE
ncbi:MAG: ABC transporter permease subunit [SAR324 cluster bacterium]|nr:ABC transporter permease subunit [SAR324 cluster bacterium]